MLTLTRRDLYAHQMSRLLFTHLIVGFFIIAAAARAEEATPGVRLNGEGFRALSEGWTMHFRNERGDYFGSEQFLEGGKTVWLPRDGRCSRGVWAEDRDRICFSYIEGGACWRIYELGEGGLYAESAEDDRSAGAEIRLWMFRRDQRPLVCPEAPGV